MDVSVAVHDLDSLNGSLLVVVIEDGDGQVKWTASQFDWYKPEGDGWYRVYHTFRPGNPTLFGLLEKI